MVIIEMNFVNKERFFGEYKRHTNSFDVKTYIQQRSRGRLNVINVQETVTQMVWKWNYL